MKILIYSSTFLPNIGGLENIMAGLAEGFAEKGHEVTVLTETPNDGNNREQNGYRVIRGPSAAQRSIEYTNCDVILEANISLKTVLTGLRHRKKWFVVHHIHYQHSASVKAVVKNLFTLFSKNIAVSGYIKRTLFGKSKIISNFYADHFRKLEGVDRDKDLIFVGRLVSDKGAIILLQALSILKKVGIEPTATIVGDGPERQSLEEFVKFRSLANVKFEGALKGEQLVRSMNQHRFMVIPSIWNEPFGLIALEGLACGNTLISSGRGGLREASAGFGYFYNGDKPKALAKIIRVCLDSPVVSENANIDAHLAAHQREQIVEKYLELLNG